MRFLAGLTYDCVSITALFMSGGGCFDDKISSEAAF